MNVTSRYADAQLMELGDGDDGDPASRSSFTARTQAVAARLQGVFAGSGPGSRPLPRSRACRREPTISQTCVLQWRINWSLPAVATRSQEHAAFRGHVVPCPLYGKLTFTAATLIRCSVPRDTSPSNTCAALQGSAKTAAPESVTLQALTEGKTRLEAARWFFETLVLQTKDFVDLQQVGRPQTRSAAFQCLSKFCGSYLQLSNNAGVR